MPREYRQATPGGDPTNPLSLLSVVDLPQVSFTPQTAVGEPENQYEQLQRILVAGGQAAKATFDYEGQKAENMMAINNAVARAQERVEREREKIEIAQEKSAYKREVLEKKEQDGIINGFDARITAAIVAEDFDTAQAEADKFAATYPEKDNPYAHGKAQDQRLRVQSARRIAEERANTQADRTSAAIRGEAFFKIMDEIQVLEGKFQDPSGAGRADVMSMFNGGRPNRDGQPEPYVPNSQLHQKLGVYLMGRLPPEMYANLNQEDITQLQTQIISYTENLRTNVTNERARQETFKIIEERTNASIYLASSIKDPADLPKLFQEFDMLEQDKQNKNLTQIQQDNLERNLVYHMGRSLGAESPVTGGLAWAKLIDAGVKDGSIPERSGNRIIAQLQKRSEAEAKMRINGIMLGAREKNPNESTYLYEEYPFVNPAIDIGLQLGVYERDPETQAIKTVEGAEKVGKLLDDMSAEWVRQEARFVKKSGVTSNIETIDAISVVDNQTSMVISTHRQDKTILVEQGFQKVILPEVRGAFAYANDPRNGEKYAISLKRGSDKLIAEFESGQDRSKFSTVTVRGGKNISVPPEVIGNEIFRTAYETVNAGDSRDAMRYLLTQTTPDNMDDHDNRVALMYAYSMVVDQNMTGGQREMAMSPNPKQSNLWTREELYDVTVNSSRDLYKGWSKMSALQRQTEEDRTARLVQVTKYFPDDFLKYTAEQYFVAGSSPQSIERGYDLMVAARGVAEDDLGRPVDNVSSFGSAEAELRMQEEHPLMYYTIVAAEGKAIRRYHETGQPVDPREFLRESFANAQSVLARRESKQSPERATMDMIPPVRMDPVQQKPMRDRGTLVGDRYEMVRTAIAKVYGETNIPRTNEFNIGQDPYLNLDPEDLNRMDVYFQEARIMGFSTDTAIEMSVRQMAQEGYKIITPGSYGEFSGTSGSERVMFISDPYNVVPPPDVMKSPEFKGYLSDIASKIKGARVNLGGKGGYLITFNFNNSYTDATSSIYASLTDPNGANRVEIATGINMEDYRLWQTDRDAWSQRFTMVGD